MIASFVFSSLSSIESPQGLRSGVQPMTRARNWLIATLAMVVAVAVSYAWLDRPIALFAHALTRGFALFEKLTFIPELMAPLAILVFVMLAVDALAGRPMPKLPTVALIAAASLAVASAIKDQLKFAFGRTWPETWIRDNQSFIRDGVYGFNPFHGGPGFAAFPSGHTTVVCAVMSVLWVCYPRYRAAYAICVAAVAVGLIGADFHFLSDVIAGAYLGTLTGWLIVVLWDLGYRPMHSSSAASRETALRDAKQSD
jgi:membrane-associated phospholipid phosphatase